MKLGFCNAFSQNISTWGRHVSLPKLTNPIPSAIWMTIEEKHVISIRRGGEKSPSVIQRQWFKGFVGNPYNKFTWALSR